MKKDIISKIQEKLNNSNLDLDGSNLSGLDLQGKHFPGCSFKNAKIVNTNLSCADLSGCDLTDTNFKNSNLAGVNIEGAKRNGLQIIGFSSVIVNDKHHYAFLCQGKDRKTVLVNEHDKKEVEYKQATSTNIGRILYTLLING